MRRSFPPFLFSGFFDSPMLSALIFPLRCASKAAPKASVWQRWAQQTALAGLAGGLVWALLGCDAPPPKSATAPIATVAQPANTNTASAAPEAPTATQSANTVRLSALPPLGQQIYQQILQGGPFAYDKDGAVFANRERILPAQKRGYYREYTVAHAHARNRGPRRIVCGGAPRSPDACYYSADHYASFQKIVSP